MNILKLDIFSSIFLLPFTIQLYKPYIKLSPKRIPIRILHIYKKLTHLFLTPGETFLPKNQEIGEDC